MCDYSLEVYGSRPAREGERLVTSRFPSGTIGLSSPEAPGTPVCLNCDTSLAVAEIPERLRQAHGLKEKEDATFTRLETGAYRDAIRFSNGAEISLQYLEPGMQVDVKSLLENQIELPEPKRETRRTGALQSA
jgi:hypothetical protein